MLNVAKDWSTLLLLFTVVSSLWVPWPIPNPQSVSIQFNLIAYWEFRCHPSIQCWTHILSFCPSILNTTHEATVAKRTSQPTRPTELLNKILPRLRPCPPHRYGSQLAFEQTYSEFRVFQRLQLLKRTMYRNPGTCNMFPRLIKEQASAAATSDQFLVSR